MLLDVQGMKQRRLLLLEPVSSGLWEASSIVMVTVKWCFPFASSTKVAKSSPPVLWSKVIGPALVMLNPFRWSMS